MFTLNAVVARDPFRVTNKRNQAAHFPSRINCLLACLSFSFSFRHDLYIGHAEQQARCIVVVVVVPRIFQLDTVIGAADMRMKPKGQVIFDCIIIIIVLGSGRDSIHGGVRAVVVMMIFLDLLLLLLQARKYGRTGVGCQMRRGE